MDKAFQDSGEYVNWWATVDKFAIEMKNGTPNVEKYVIDYVKAIIKKRGVDDNIKLNALLFLKELSKTQN